MNQESGRSMIEMLGVLAIMGVITVGAYELIKMAFNSQKQVATEEEVFTIVSEVRRLHSGYDDFSAMNGDVVLEMLDKKQNPYGGKYTLNANASNPRQIVIGIDGLTQNECKALLTRAWRDSVGYNTSNKKESGATGSCNGVSGTNSIQIIYGE